MRNLAAILRNPKSWQIALAVFWIALFLATHLPAGTPALPPQGTDKLVHFLSFAVLGWLLATTWQISSGRLTGRHLVFAWLILAVYAAVDEWTQPWVGRTANFGDWLADVLGAAAGLALFAWLRRWHQ